MKTTAWVWLALFLSLGINLGLLASRWLPERDAASETTGETTRGTPATAGEERSPPRPAGARSDEMGPPGDPRLPPPVERRLAGVARELGLDGAERGAFLELQRDFFRRFVHSRRQVRRLQGELRRLLLSEAAERRQADALLERLVAAESEAERAFLDHYFAVRELLDEEQMRRYRRVLGELRRGASELGTRGGPARSGPVRGKKKGPGRRGPLE